MKPSGLLLVLLTSACNPFQATPNNPHALKVGIKEGSLIVSQPIVIKKRDAGDHRTILEIRSELKPSFDDKSFIPQPESATINLRARW